MKGIIWKRCIFSLVSCSFLLYHCSFSFACGPFIEEPEVSFFISDLVDNSLSPQPCKDSKPSLVEKHQNNLLEWQSFFNQNTTGLTDLEDIAYLIYEVSLEDLTEAYHKKRSNSLTLPENSRLYQLIQQIDAQTLEYIIFAKQCEPHVNKIYYSWKEEEKDIPAMRLLLTEGQEGYKRCASDFLKLRYAYQVVRLAHYIGSYEECVNLYDELIPRLNVESTIRYWALEHKAGALRRVGNVAESLYLFLTVFNAAPERQGSVSRSFQFVSADDETWQQCLGFAKNTQEKITLWKLRWSARYHGPFPLSMKPLQAIYELEPSSPLLETMLIERIRNIEHFLFSPLLRKQKFKEAFEIFKKIPEKYWEQEKYCKGGEAHNNYNNYLSSVQTYHRSPYWYGSYRNPQGSTKKLFETSFSKNPYNPAGEVEKMNKFTFTKRILELEKKAEKDRTHAGRSYWQIANAFYNTPFWGYSGIIWNGRLVDSFNWYYRPTQYPFNIPGFSEKMHYREQDFLDEYGNLSVALKYYEKALKTTKNKELGAQATLLAHLCKNTALASLHDQYYQTSNSMKNRDTTYLQLLKEKYADTSFYDRMIKECSTIKHFMSRRRTSP